MIVDVDVDRSPPVDLTDSSNFRELKCVVTGTRSPADLAEALAGIGRVVGPDHVFLAVDALAGLAGAQATDPGWRSGYEAMVDYARSQGWLDASGNAVRAHCEFVGSGPGPISPTS